MLNAKHAKLCQRFTSCTSIMHIMFPSNVGGCDWECMPLTEWKSMLSSRACKLHAGNGERIRTVPFYFYSPHLRSLVCCPIGTERVMNRRSMRVRGRVDGLGRLGRAIGCNGLGWRRGSLGGLGDKQERQEVCRTGGWDPRVWERETVWMPGMIGALFRQEIWNYYAIQLCASE